MALTIICTLFMYGNFIIYRPEYINLVQKTNVLIGCINYTLYCLSSKIQYNFYSLIDDIQGKKINSYQYFL